MQPILKHPQTGEVLTTEEAYRRIVKLLGLSGQEDDLPPDQRWKRDEYRMELLGPLTIVKASSEYWEYRMLIDLGISPEEWRSMPIHERCKLRAASQLKGMTELIEHHWRAMIDKQKQQSQRK